MKGAAFLGILCIKKMLLVSQCLVFAVMRALMCISKKLYELFKI